jgi:hypothetical protein
MTKLLSKEVKLLEKVSEAASRLFGVLGNLTSKERDDLCHFVANIIRGK